MAHYISDNLVDGEISWITVVILWLIHVEQTQVWHLLDKALAAGRLAAAVRDDNWADRAVRDASRKFLPYQLWTVGSRPTVVVTGTGNRGLIPEREPERWLPLPRKAAGAQITQSRVGEVVTGHDGAGP